jgi:hypothetical protein
VHASWTAEAGHYYYENQNGKRVQRVRWSYASGAIDHFFDDELVCASTGVASWLLKKVEPFPTATLIPYDPGYVAGWTVERYQIDLVNAAQHSRQAMDAKIRQLCADDVPGDTQRNLQVNATYTDQRFKHILVPVWLLTYTYGPQGVSRWWRTASPEKWPGDRPWSWIKIALLVILALFVLYLYGQTN